MPPRRLCARPGSRPVRARLLRPAPQARQLTYRLVASPAPPTTIPACQATGGPRPGHRYTRLPGKSALGRAERESLCVHQTPHRPRSPVGGSCLSAGLLPPLEAGLPIRRLRSPRGLQAGRRYTGRTRGGVCRTGHGLRSPPSPVILPTPRLAAPMLGRRAGSQQVGGCHARRQCPGGRAHTQAPGQVPAMGHLVRSSGKRLGSRARQENARGGQRPRGAHRAGRSGSAGRTRAG